MTDSTSRAVAVNPGHVDGVVRDWLETQAHIVGYWREVLVSADGDASLIAALDDHASFLQAAARIGTDGFHRHQ